MKDLLVQVHGLVLNTEHTQWLYIAKITRNAQKLHSVDLSKIILNKFIKVLITKVHVIGFY